MTESMLCRLRKVNRRWAACASPDANATQSRNQGSRSRQLQGTSLEVTAPKRRHLHRLDSFTRVWPNF